MILITITTDISQPVLEHIFGLLYSGYSILKQNIQIMQDSDVLVKAENFISQYYAYEIPEALSFHNLGHIKSVLNGAKAIMEEEKISEKERELLLIAIWFHDCGMAERYSGHESCSKSIAKVKLEEWKYPSNKIEKILALIEATRMPQNPRSHLEEIICDADLFHLSEKDYFERLEDLRIEWETILNTKYDETVWCRENLNFLKNHQFFTTYGKNVLQNRKWRNYQKLSTWAHCMEGVTDSETEFLMPS